MTNKFAVNKKSFFRILFAGLGIFSLIYGVFAFTFAGFNLGVVIVLFCGIILLLIGHFIEFLLKHKWIIVILCAAAFAAVSLLTAMFIYASNCEVNYNEDAVIILGCGINGEKVKPQLARRLDAGVEYYNKNPDAIIVVSGGIGPTENITEAEAMEKYLLSKGIPQDHIIKEEASTSTYSNLYNSKQLLDDHFKSDYTSVVITSNFHLLRTGSTAKYLDMSCNFIGAETPPLDLPLCSLRECAAICKYFVDIIFGTLK